MSRKLGLPPKRTDPIRWFPVWTDTIDILSESTGTVQSTDSISCLGVRCVGQTAQYPLGHVKCLIAQSIIAAPPTHDGEETNNPSLTWRPYVKMVFSSNPYSRQRRGITGNVDRLHGSPINTPHGPSLQVSFEHPRNTLYIFLTTTTQASEPPCREPPSPALGPTVFLCL